MHLHKTPIYHLNKCYSMTGLQYNGTFHFVVASEKADSCLLFSADGKMEEPIWEGPGGTMSMVQVPGTNGAFLAVQKFYSPDQSENARVVAAFPSQKGWKVRTLAELPFVHRIDILQSGGTCYFIACTLKSGNRFAGDWSMPGKVYAARLPKNFGQDGQWDPLELRVVKDSMKKNHGYYRAVRDGKESSVISCDSGVYRFFPPENQDDSWHVKRILSQPTSDAVLVDFDEDGKDELAVLSPYHGDTFQIYKESCDCYEKVFECQHKLPFIHALYGGAFLGKPTVIVGHREGRKDLLAFSFDKGKGNYREEMIDSGCGPANLLHYVWNGQDVLIATNREIDEIAMYME